MAQINKNEQGCLGPKECKYASSHHSSEKSMNSAYMWVKAIKRVKQESYLWKEKNVFLSQQARRGTNYELYINNGHVYETRRMLEQLWKLYFGMLLRSFPASPSFWRFFPFWKWRHQPGWVHQRMWRSWFHACWAQVRLCWTQIHQSLKGPPVLPLWQCWASIGVRERLGHVWDFLPSHTNVSTTSAWNCWELRNFLAHNGQFSLTWKKL